MFMSSTKVGLEALNALFLKAPIENVQNMKKSSKNNKKCIRRNLNLIISLFIFPFVLNWNKAQNGVINCELFIFCDNILVNRARF